MEHADRVAAEHGRLHLEHAVLDAPHAAVGREAVRILAAVLEGRRAQHVARASRNVARLDVLGCARLVLPVDVALVHQADLAVRLAVAFVVLPDVPGRVGAARLGQVVQVLLQLREQRPADRERAERGERHEVAVELADPVDQPVAAGVRDEAIATRAAVRGVLVGRVRIRDVVCERRRRSRNVGIERRVVIVVDVEQVVAAAAEHAVATGATHQPIVSDVAEQVVVAVGRLRVEGRAERVRVVRPFARIEVQYEGHAAVVFGETAVLVDEHLAQRVELVVGREFVVAVDGTVAEDVARVERVVVIDRQRLGARDRVVAGAAVQEVAAETAEQDVVGIALVLIGERVGIELEGLEVHGLLQRAVRVDQGELQLAGRVDRLVGVLELADAPQRLGELERISRTLRVAAGRDAAVFAQDAVDTGAARDPVVAHAADQIVVF